MKDHPVLSQPQEFTTKIPEESFQAKPRLDPARCLPAGLWLSSGDGQPARALVQTSGVYHILFSEYGKKVDVALVTDKSFQDPLAEEITKYSAYWRPLPKNWQALDFYRVRQMFPLPPGKESARLDHSLKKLLIPGNRTGGKSFRKDIAEAYATLGQWLRDNPED